MRDREFESDYGKVNVVSTNQSVEMRECLSRKENRGSGKAKAEVCCCRFTWCICSLPMHCSEKGPYFRDRVPIGIFLTFWVLIGSLFIFQGLYFQCFGSIHAKNVNSVCMYATMSELDLCSLKP